MWNPPHGLCSVTACPATALCLKWAGWDLRCNAPGQFSFVLVCWCCCKVHGYVTASRCFAVTMVCLRVQRKVAEAIIRSWEERLPKLEPLCRMLLVADRSVRHSSRLTASADQRPHLLGQVLPDDVLLTSFALCCCVTCFLWGTRQCIRPFTRKFVSLGSQGRPGRHSTCILRSGMIYCGGVHCVVKHAASAQRVLACHVFDAVLPRSTGMQENLQPRTGWPLTRRDLDA